MRLASVTVNGRATYGAVTDKGLVDLGAVLGAKYPDLKSLIAAGAMAEAAAAAAAAKSVVPMGALNFLPVIPNPDKILCIGLNYEEHRAETKRDKVDHPTVFLRVPESQVGHGEPMLCPRESTKFDYEGEIVVIIGKPGRRIAEADAWGHIAGYSAYNEGSVRDWQRHTTQFTAGKNFAHTGAFGPWMVTADEIPPGTDMTLVTRLNGQVMQQAASSQMIFPIPRLIAYCSAFATLLPGDVIVTGTPGGVGSRREPPVWMKPGDVAEVEVGGVGVLRNTIEVD